MLLTVVLGTATFVTSIVSGVLGMAGGVALVGVMAALLAGPMVVPLHGMVQLFSNGSRVALMWKDVAWREALTFLGPLVVGVVIGAYFGRGLAFKWLEPSIGALLIAFVLWRRFGQSVHHGGIALWVYAVTGFLVGAASLYIGATGPMAAPVFRRDDWTPQKTVATMAIAQAGGHFMKLPAFLALGFNYTPHIPVLALLFVCAAIGTWVGRKALDAIPKDSFAMIFDFVLFALGVYLILHSTHTSPSA